MCRRRRHRRVAAKVAPLKAANATAAEVPRRHSRGVHVVEVVAVVAAVDLRIVRRRHDRARPRISSPSPTTD